VKRTPLYPEHIEAGARMVDFAGWEMPVQYASIVKEHLAVRSGAGIFDVSHMGEIFFEGPAAKVACSKLFVNDARRLSTGQGQYSLIPNEEGGVVDDVIVYRLAEQTFLVCVNASNIEKDFDWLRDRAPEGCAVTNRSDRYALLAVQGPAALDVLRQVLPDAEIPKRFAFSNAKFHDGEVLIARTGYTGEDGCEIFVAPDAAAALWQAFVAAGAVPAGLGARDTLRLEAALPLYGHELDDRISPYEAGLGWVVKLNRPEMTGYKALLTARDEGVGRRLVGLVTEGGIARQGCAVLAGDQRIGTVTSGSVGPELGHPVALALVTGQAGSGEAVAVEIRGRLKNARVTNLPFYVRQARSL
jgi:aminomethyltransferase